MTGEGSTTQRQRELEPEYVSNSSQGMQRLLEWIGLMENRNGE